MKTGTLLGIGAVIAVIAFVASADAGSPSLTDPNSVPVTSPGTIGAAQLDLASFMAQYYPATAWAVTKPSDPSDPATIQATALYQAWYNQRLPAGRQRLRTDGVIDGYTFTALSKTAVGG